MMKMSTLLAAGTLGLLGLGTAAKAAPADLADKKWEITLGGTGTNNTDFDEGSFAANVQVGYYFSEALEVVARQSGGYTDFGDSSWFAQSSIGVQYHFDFGQDQRIVPFVGAFVGYRYGDATDDSITASPEAGVKFYVNDTTFVYGQVAYDFLLKESVSDGQFDYAVGIGFRF